jgi:hypothetical protein
MDKDTIAYMLGGQPNRYWDLLDEDQQYCGTYCLSEANLSRLLSRMTGRVFGVISGWRSQYPKSKNVQRQDALRLALRDQGLMGHYELIGYWRECQLMQPDGKTPVPYDQCPEDQKVATVEDSLLYVKPDDMQDDAFVERLVQGARQMAQDCIIIGFPNGNQHDVFLYYSSGGRKQIGTGTTLNKIAQGYSVMRQKQNVPFVFEGLRVPSGGMLSCFALQAKGIEWLS